MAFFVKTLSLLVIIAFNVPSYASEDDCSSHNDYNYICGLNSPEDLVSIPDSDWVIASGFAGNKSLYLVNARTKAVSEFYPAAEAVAFHDLVNYGKCPGSPDPTNFTAHGLNIRQLEDSLFILNVVGHGDREAVEVFIIDTSDKSEPVIAWVGCVLTPDNLAANSVTSLQDGSLLATIPLHKGYTIDDAFKGKPTGAVYRWTPGDETFTKIEGTELVYANGIEVSDDGSEFYIASSGDIKVLAFSNTNPAKLLRTSAPLDIVPDNLRWGTDGKLVTAGMTIKEPACKDVVFNGNYTFEDFFSCPRAFKAYAFDATDLSASVLEESKAQPQFSNITMVLEVNDELWFGAFSGNRLAYTRRD
jgi:hypothetical protein